MHVAVRFAPSPTGRLHVGNIRIALANRLFAWKHGGTFLLRLDDTDRERSDEAFAEGIREDLRWLGLDWDREERQSARLARYAEAAGRLRAAGRLYPCWETEEELEAKARLLRARGRPPVYDRAALRLDAAEKARLEAERGPPHWRFLLEPGAVAWDDMVQGAKSFDAAVLSDPVLVRADGQPLYAFASVVDDADHGITHVIRGEDHVTNTAAQIALLRALGAPVPAFAHLPLVVDAAGEGLSKRTGALSVATLRAEGVEASAVVSLLAALGTSDPVELRGSARALADRFDPARVSRSPPRFDAEDLRRLSRQAVHAMPWAEARPRLEAMGLEAMGIGDAGEALWDAVRGNLDRVADAAVWARVVAGPVEAPREDPALLAEAARLLPPEPWDAGTWKAWTGAVAAATGRKGRDLFHPLRLALTGKERGPDLAALLPLVGRERTLERLAPR